jgi:hypothetical protein
MSDVIVAVDNTPKVAQIQTSGFANRSILEERIAKEEEELKRLMEQNKLLKHRIRKKIVTIVILHQNLKVQRREPSRSGMGISVGILKSSKQTYKSRLMSLNPS